jgi:membrane protease YdiL (CAAX protease family)
MNDMIEPIVKKPLIPWGWLRVLLFCVLYFITVVLVYIPVGILIVLFKKDSIEKGKAPDIGSLMNGEFLWLTILIGVVIAALLVFVFRKFIDRKSFASLGFETHRHRADALTGMFLAPAILGTGALILFASGHLNWTDISFNGSDLFISFGIFVMVAFSEELVFRGYILNNLMQSFNKWVALLISAVLFTVFHLGVPGMGFVPVVNVFLAGVLIGINYVYTKNLWFAFLFHLAWNFFQGPILGFKVSGITLQSLLQSELKGDLLLTGGDFGFEGSVIDMALSIVAILCVYLVYERKMRERLIVHGS